MLAPGNVGSGVACTGGVNRLPPLGLMLFSVGEAGALLGGGVVVVVGVVVVEAGGAWLPPLPQAAITAPMAMSAAPPKTAWASEATGEIAAIDAEV